MAALLTTHVELAEARDHGLHQGLDLVGLAGVAGEGLDLDAGGAQPLGRRGHALDLARGDGDLRAALPEGLGDRLADAAAAAGDEGDLAVDVYEGHGGRDGSAGIRRLAFRIRSGGFRPRLPGFLGSFSGLASSVRSLFSRMLARALLVPCRAAQIRSALDKRGMKMNRTMGCAVVASVLACTVAPRAFAAGEFESERGYGYLRQHVSAPENNFEIGTDLGYSQGFGSVWARGGA